MIYGGFWRRIGSAFLDGFILTPLTVVSLFVGPHYRLFYLYYALPGLAFSAFYFIYLVKKFGGTPGQLILKMRVAMPDGAKVTTKAAILRNGITYLLTAFTQIGLIIASLHTTNAEFFASDGLAREATLMQHGPTWLHALILITQAWFWSEYLVLLFNKKRRGLQDFMAGTVVIRTDLSAL